MTTSNTAVSSRQVYAAVAICIAMMGALLWMPAYLGVLHEAYAMPASALGNLAFIETGGFLIATIFTSTKTIAQIKRWGLICCTVLAAVNIVLAASDWLPLMIARAITGFAAGAGFGYALKLCGVSANPTRLFGILTAAMSLMMIVGFQTTAYFVDHIGSGGARQVVQLLFAAYAALAIVAAVLLATNSPSHVAAGGSHAAPRGMPSPIVVIALAGIVLTYAGQGGVWAFLQTLGVAHGFPVAGVANAMSTFAIMGIVGSLFAAAVPGQTPRSLLIGAALLALFAGLYALYAPASLLWYTVGCAVCGFYWNFVLPLMLGILARIDPTGRGSVLGGSMSSAGSGLGPLLAGTLIQGTNYQPVGWLTAALCVSGLICVMLVESRNAAVAVTPAG